MVERHAEFLYAERRVEGLIEVGDDVVDVLDPDAQPDHLGTDACGFELICGHLPVRRRGRMAGQRLGVANIDQPLDETERVVEPLAGIEPSFYAERQQRGGAAAQIAPRERVVWTVAKSSVVDPGDARIIAQEVRDLASILDVPFDPQRERLDALEQEEPYATVSFLVSKLSC
jgi:hypothetical protein